MRVQHNIMAMNAYRNYTNNVSSMKKNLERLSSGYKINRAGDDAAGLAISEKMRAQITGLETAQKNAKDGISLVQTAEGALTEVHDMLNRMIELASQSANGTYDNDTDRLQLQKEVNQLMSEINRIADSSNFNGIQLLDGSMAVRAAQMAKTTENTEIIEGMDRIIKTLISKGEKAHEVAGQKSVLDTNSKGTPQKAVFEIDLSTMIFKPNDSEAEEAAGNITINVGGTDLKLGTAAIKTTNSGGTTGAELGTIHVKDIVSSIYGNKKNFNDGEEGGHTVTINGVDWTVEKTADEQGLKFTQKSDPKTVEEAYADFDVTISIKGAGADKFEISLGGKSATADIDGIYSIKTSTVVTQYGAPATDANKANTVFEIRESDLVDGTRIAIGTMSLILQIGGSASKVQKDAGKTAPTGTEICETGETIVKLNAGDDLRTALGKISETIYLAQGKKHTFEMKYVDSKDVPGTATFQIGVNDGSNGGPIGLSIQRVNPYNTDTNKQANTSQAYGFQTLESLAQNFKMEVTTVTKTEAKEAQNGLMLQIGDTADEFNQLRVSINDCHVDAIGIGSISIADQESAQAAVDSIRKAINYVSDVRGTLGATQNRLEHTINNLSVMQENIQDAESTIRDVDIAEEMMAYTKNNILIQSAQAMLAQANQVPQGVLQLLQ